MRILLSTLLCLIVTTANASMFLDSGVTHTMVIDGQTYTSNEANFSPVMDANASVDEFPGSGVLDPNQFLYSQLVFTSLPSIGDTATIEGFVEFELDNPARLYIVTREERNEELTLSINGQELPDELGSGVKQGFYFRNVDAGVNRLSFFGTGTAPLGASSVGSNTAPRLHTISVSFFPIPEPTGVSLLAIAAAGFITMRRWRGRFAA